MSSIFNGLLNATEFQTTVIIPLTKLFENVGDGNEKRLNQITIFFLPRPTQFPVKIKK